MTSAEAHALTAEQIAALPTYSWDIAQIGDAAPPFTYAVTEQSIADYCQAEAIEGLVMPAKDRREGPLVAGRGAPHQPVVGCIAHPRLFASPAILQG